MILLLQAFQPLLRRVCRPTKATLGLSVISNLKPPPLDTRQSLGPPSPEIGEKDPGRRRRRRATTFVEVFRPTSLTSGPILTLVLTSRREEPAQSPPYKTVKVAGIRDQSLGDSIQFRAFSGYTTSIRGLLQSLEYLNPTPFAVLYRYGRLKEVATIPVGVARAKAATVCTPMQADMSYPFRL